MNINHDELKTLRRRIKECGLSSRKLAKLLGIPHSTLAAQLYGDYRLQENIKSNILNILLTTHKENSK